MHCVNTYLYFCFCGLPSEVCHDLKHLFHLFDIAEPCLAITWPRSLVVIVPSPQISNSLNTSWQGPHPGIPALILLPGAEWKLYQCQYFIWAGCWGLPCNTPSVSVTNPQWPSINKITDWRRIYVQDRISRFSARLTALISSSLTFCSSI